VVLQASYNVISHNNISYSGGNGVYIEKVGMANNEITYNNFTFNDGWGVKVMFDGGVNQIHQNNFICNKGDCSYGYQGYDAFTATTHYWDNGSVGNYWTNDSLWNNKGNDTLPKTYYVDPFPHVGMVKDMHPQWEAIRQAGPRP
jgi:hypothetical protein